MSQKNENFEQNDVVDNYILGFLIALIASGLMVLSAKKPENHFLCYFLASAFLFNIILFFVLYGIRYACKKG